MPSIYLKAAFALMAVAFSPSLAMAHSPEAHSAIGEPGRADAVTRTIQVKMSDSMRFHPEKISVKRGETIRFVVHNDGIEPHEFMLGEIKKLQEHAEVMRKHPTMVHDDPNAITVNPSQTGELIWKFTKSGRVDFACLIPGHFEKGMKGDIQVSR